MNPDREALARAMAIMAMPQYYLRYESWPAFRRPDKSMAGDMSYELNHYTKRATLSAVYEAYSASLLMTIS